MFPHHLELILETCSAREWLNIDIDVRDFTLGIMDPIFIVSPIYSKNKSMDDSGLIVEDRIFYTILGLIQSLGVKTFFWYDSPKRIEVMVEILRRSMAIQKSNVQILDFAAPFTLHFADDYPDEDNIKRVLDGLIQSYRELTVSVDLEMRLVELFERCLANEEENSLTLDETTMVLSRHVFKGALNSSGDFVKIVMLKFWLDAILAIDDFGPWSRLLLSDWKGLFICWLIIR
jgi:hypothetical protein